MQIPPLPSPQGGSTPASTASGNATPSANLGGALAAFTLAPDALALLALQGELGKDRLRVEEQATLTKFSNDELRYLTQKLA
jgi:hypothetical protein